MVWCVHKGYASVSSERCISKSDVLTSSLQEYSCVPIVTRATPSTPSTVSKPLLVNMGRYLEGKLCYCNQSVVPCGTQEQFKTSRTTSFTPSVPRTGNTTSACRRVLVNKRLLFLKKSWDLTHVVSLGYMVVTLLHQESWRQQLHAERHMLILTSSSEKVF